MKKKRKREKEIEKHQIKLLTRPLLFQLFDVIKTLLVKVLNTIIVSFYKMPQQVTMLIDESTVLDLKKKKKKNTVRKKAGAMISSLTQIDSFSLY